MNKKDSIKAYDLAERIKNYDADMDKMHPKRYEMIDIALEFLPFESISSLKAIDLGTGTGVFTEKFINEFPNSKILAIDGAKTMVDLAMTRLGDLVNNIDFEISDFRKFELNSKIDAILTRNLKDYKNSEISAMSPETYLKIYFLDSNA